MKSLVKKTERKVSLKNTAKFLEVITKAGWEENDHQSRFITETDHTELF